MDDFDAQVGLPYLRGLHLNDSKALLASKKDRHENIEMYVLIFPHMLSAHAITDIFSALAAGT